jgi:hypothetical protein
MDVAAWLVGPTCLWRKGELPLNLVNHAKCQNSSTLYIRTSLFKDLKPAGNYKYMCHPLW